MKEISKFLIPLLNWLHSQSKEVNSGITACSMLLDEKYEENSIYIVYARKGESKEEILKTFKDLLD